MNKIDSVNQLNRLASLVPKITSSCPRKVEQVYNTASKLINKHDVSSIVTVAVAIQIDMVID
ncbi:hypothetical protein GPAL_1077 [Glaciecola pallidula DSM 14239 = ACAM 615]|uniref:Uncharacterized protein n=1 Tax=Brumicola pallidula DSM 14239 = ACAM 615 TaxID=1121922 RepID=K6YVE8_9ALTE|nr:hypothetical protein GPAL_1077 [Glaciecola pallidula DSM 14239 = ACAM 615]